MFSKMFRMQELCCMFVYLLFSRYFLKGTTLRSLYCSLHVFTVSVSFRVVGKKPGTHFKLGGVRTLYMSEKSLWLHWNGFAVGKWVVQTAHVNKRGRRQGKTDHLLTQKQVELHVILVKYHGRISSWFFFFFLIDSVEYSSVWHSSSVLSICVWRILPVLLHHSLCLLK